MKKRIAIVMSLLLSCNSWAAIAFIQSRSSSNSSTSAALAYTSSVTAHSLLVVGCESNRVGSSLNVTDASGDTFTIIGGTTTNDSPNSSHTAGMWYAFNAVGGATTVTCTDTRAVATWVQLSITEYSGAASGSDPFDVTSSSTPAVLITTTTYVSNYATTTSANDMMVAYAVAGRAPVTGNGTIRENFVNNNFMAWEDAPIPTASVYQSSFTAASGSTTLFIMIQAAFKAPAAVPFGSFTIQ